jgi:hypothetical protein
MRHVVLHYVREPSVLLVTVFRCSAFGKQGSIAAGSLWRHFSMGLRSPRGTQHPLLWCAYHGALIMVLIIYKTSFLLRVTGQLIDSVPPPP